MHDEAYKKIMEQAGKKPVIIAEGVAKPPIFNKVHELAEHYK